MKTPHLRWLIAGIGALLLMSSFTVYLILRDRRRIDASFAVYHTYVDSLNTLRSHERELLHCPMTDAPVSRVQVPDTALRNLRIREAELKLQSEHLLADAQKVIHASDNKKLLWTSLMGVAGLIGLSIIFAGKKSSST